MILTISPALLSFAVCSAVCEVAEVTSSHVLEPNVSMGFANLPLDFTSFFRNRQLTIFAKHPNSLTKRRSYFLRGQGLVRVFHKLDKDVIECLECDSVIIFQQDFSREELQKFLSEPAFGTGPAWWLIGGESLLWAKLRLNQKIFYFRLDTSHSVWETYSVGNVTIHRKIEVSSITGALTEAEQVLLRRSNLQGEHLSALAESQEPYLRVHVSVTEENAAKVDDETLIPVQISGIFASVLEMMAKRLNFTYESWKRVDGAWGDFNLKSKQFDGIVGNIARGEVDFAVAPMTLQIARASGIDYLMPIGTETYGLFVKSTGTQELDWTVFIDPFSYKTWIVLLINAAFTAMTIQLVVYCLGIHRDKPWDCSALCTAVSSYWLVFCSYFGRGTLTDDLMSLTYKNWTRATFFCICLFGNFVFMSYRASLTSELASVMPFKKPFSTLMELLRSDYQ